MHRNLQDRDAVVLELLHLLVPAGGGERGRITPGVVVEREEVAANRVVSAVHVCGHLVAVGLDIGGRVSDRDLSQSAGVHVRLDIAGHGLHVRSAVRGRVIVNDLVGGEEKQSVVILGELLDSGEDALQVLVVVRRLRVSPVDGVVRGVDVERQVDSSVGLSTVSLCQIEHVGMDIPKPSCTRRGWRCCR
jgi:hypothetical protein